MAAAIPNTFDQIRAQIEEISAAGRLPDQGTSTQPLSPIVVPVAAPLSDWRLWLVAGAGLIALGVVAIAALRASRRLPPKVVVPKATLHDLGGHSGKDKHSITKSVTRIGRDAKTNDIVLPYDTVTSQHATIEFRNGAFYLRDLRSTNGTFVNGKKFSDGETIREVALKHRDYIRFDAYEFEFVLDALQDAQQTMIAGETSGRTRLRPEPPSPSGKEPGAPTSQPAQAAGESVPPEGPPAPIGGDGKTRVKPDMCPRHPSFKATQLCTKCGRAWCEYCMNEKDGKEICVECVAKAVQPIE